MRIRQVKPSFWSDSTIADLREPTRLFYIGLWMIADDAGWLRWDGPEVAKDLYGYEVRSRREARVEKMLAELVGCRRVVLHDCGHVEIPTLVEHQHLAGLTKQVRTAMNDHMRGCASAPPTPADTRADPPLPASVRSGKDVVREGQERSGQETARASAEETTEFRQRVAPPRVA